MVYVTAFGARKSRNLNKRSLSLFVMGRVTVESRKNSAFTLKDMEIYNNSEALSVTLPAYYTACICVELARAAVGADHRLQFRILVEILLYLIENAGKQWREALAVFLWQSLENNGWQPELPSTISAHRYWVLDYTGALEPQHDTEKLPEQKSSRKNRDYVSHNDYSTPYRIQAKILELLKTHARQSSKNAVEALTAINSETISSFIRFLLNFWQKLLGKPILSVKYIQNML